jgi:hypothetical protein
VDVEAFTDYRLKFWGDVPTARVRREKVAAALQEAQDNFLIEASLDSLDPDDYPDQLLFKFNGKEVCQKFFANLVNMAADDGFKNKQWVDEVNIFKGRKNPPNKQKKEAQSSGGARRKQEHAYAYILTTVDSQIMDKSAHANYDNHLYLPYHTLTALFDEYVYVCRQRKDASYAQKTTFAAAMSQVIKNKKRAGIAIRLSGGKGKRNILLPVVLTCAVDVSCYSCLLIRII